MRISLRRVTRSGNRLHFNSMNILQFAAYSITTRWFIVGIATIMMALSASSYDYNSVSFYLFTTGMGVFFTVALFLVIKAILYYKDLLHELLDPQKLLYSFSLVGIVALTGICASRLFGWHTVTYIFWYAALVLWVSITLSSFTILFLYRKSEDRRIEDILHGGWFFVVVGTQFTALLSIDVAGQATGHTLLIQYFSFALWSVGTFLCLMFMTFMIFRLVFYPVTHDTELSSYWMNTGAAAVTAVVCAALHQQIHMTGGPLGELLSFLKGFSLFFWSIGLWWLPFLIILAIRKQVKSGWKLPFTVGYWEVVLAICLFAAGTTQLTGLFDEHFLITFALYISIIGAVAYCSASSFTLAHLIVIPAWKTIPLQAVTIKWHPIRRGTIHILQIAACSASIRWFAGVMVTITVPFVSSPQAYSQVSPCTGSSTGRLLLTGSNKTGSSPEQNTLSDYMRTNR
ncbi:MAG: tellurite resistance/C4-dicarboxylate transporter family protein [Candidatus Scalindua sp.]|nr:tellurite resistance/C4-dicarboxylate transporter family protein [Candidatus Scalindua sp.]